MPPLERMDRKEYAVLWVAEGYDADGEPKVSDTPVELKVRWVEGQKEALNAEGEPIAIDATVIVDRKIPIGSLLWRGRLRDIPTSKDFSSQEEKPRVVAMYSNAGDLKNRFTRYSVGVSGFRDTLPGYSSG